MLEQVLSVAVDNYTAQRLAEVARDREIGVEVLAAEALSLFVMLEDQPKAPYTWSQEDLDAIQQGIDQLDRGEGVDQDIVEREIDELLRS